MYYLADFKRRYEKWLYENENKNKEVIVPQLNTSNKKRKVSEVKTIIGNTRKNNLKRGRTKTTKTYIESQKRLRKYTGGINEEIKLTKRQQRIKELAIKNKDSFERKKANKVLPPSDRPLITFNPDKSSLSVPSKEEITKSKTKIQNLVSKKPQTNQSTRKTQPTQRASVKTTSWDSIKTNNVKQDMRDLQAKINDLPNKVSEAIRKDKKVVTINLGNPTTTSEKAIEPSKVSNNKLGRKVLTGLGVTALGFGALYGLNKLRKSRADKGKTRGRYKQR